MQIIFFLLICASLIGQHNGSTSDKATAVQIVYLENHTIRVDSKILDKILGNEHIKDRNVMIFSIAGPYRKGKSFFLNFPLKYLHAQVKGFRKASICRSQFFNEIIFLQSM